jgi:homoserine kinase
VAARVDGHPENAAASVVGGLVAATTVKGAVRAVRMPLDIGLVFVAVVPDRSLSTSRARQSLPPQVARTDATFNLGRLSLLLAGLADRSLLIREATEDRLHQDYRSPLFPEAPQILARLVADGALASCWSGAGPTLLGFCDGADGESVRTKAQAAMAEIGVPGRALLLRPDLEGLVIDDGESGIFDIGRTLRT